MSVILVPGVCQICGCTDELACEGGCSWVDDERTLCSQCAKRQEAEWLDGDDSLDAFDRKVVLGAAEELKTLPPIRADIHPVVAIELLGAAQLALRHPALPAEQRERIASAVRDLAAWFEQHECPHVKAMIRLGWVGTGYSDDGLPEVAF